jgi:hypothetical protein
MPYLRIVSFILTSFCTYHDRNASIHAVSCRGGWHSGDMEEPGSELSSETTGLTGKRGLILNYKQM